jgi:hypothetical protein
MDFIGFFTIIQCERRLSSFIKFHKKACDGGRNKKNNWYRLVVIFLRGAHISSYHNDKNNPIQMIRFGK